MSKKNKSVTKVVAAPVKAPTATVETKAVAAPAPKVAVAPAVKVAAPAAKVAIPATPPAKSATVRPNVTLELVYPQARQVCVAGSFNNWRPETAPLAPAGNGRWVGGLSVKPGRHEYLFVVDGQWVPDPNAKERVENPYGGQNSVLLVTE